MDGAACVGQVKMSESTFLLSVVSPLSGFSDRPIASKWPEWQKIWPKRTTKYSGIIHERW